MLKKIKKNILAIAILVTFAGVLSSCYYDYGVDSEDSNIVGTLYDNTYPFNTVTKYILDPNVNKLGDITVTPQIEATIISTVTDNLRNNLGWEPFTTGDSTAAGIVRVSTAITSSTYTVYSGGGWYGGGYYYGYPYYGGGYSYTYTTGTVLVAMADPSNTTGGQQSGVWIGILNGVTGQAYPNGLITTGINQAFSNAQSPYLYE